MSHDSPAGTLCDAAPVTIVSFGFGHAPAPAAHAVFDVRDHFKDPHIRPGLRNLTAADAAVVVTVMSTPGVKALIDSIVAMVRAFRDAPQSGPVTIAVGCVGGRHRSAVIAAQAARRLADAGIPVTLTHRDLHLPVIERPACGAS
jgi:UPF0042 nucleotide-binding protein